MCVDEDEVLAAMLIWLCSKAFLHEQGNVNQGIAELTRATVGKPWSFRNS
jgi:hypothetical protein